MNRIKKPAVKPKDPRFSSGPCKKYPTFSCEHFVNTTLGRSHRAREQKQVLKSAITRTKNLLRLPPGYEMMITPASDTGAVEICLWNLLGQRGVEVLAWEAFSHNWYTDITQELRLQNVCSTIVEYGELPDFNKIDFDKDVVFCWNGTTSGVRIPDAACIPSDRKGLTICDATSAIFAQTLDYTKLDVITFSWQKCLGGEGQHGMIIFSPRALERLETYTPTWPIPKIFQIKKANKINTAIFEGDTLNTPSLLLLQDYHLALNWAESIGGLEALHRRSDRNAAIIEKWLDTCKFMSYLPKDKKTCSNTSNCLQFCAPEFLALSTQEQRDFCKKFTNLLEELHVAYDIGAYRTAPPGLRIWTGPTIEEDDLVALIPWLEWAWYELISE